MNARLLITISGVLLLVTMGVVAVGQGVINFDPTTYNPAVGSEVTFLVGTGQTAAGMRYEWYFTGGDVADVTTTNPSVDHTYTVPGYVAVTLKAVSPTGRTMMRRKGLLVGVAPLFGVRAVEPQPDGSVIVSITIFARVPLSGVGVEETIPVGWQVGASNSSGVYIKRAGSKLQVLWLNQLTPDDTPTFSYQLYPTARDTGVPTFAGTISGYDNGKRVSTEICGDLTVPY